MTGYDRKQRATRGATSTAEEAGPARVPGRGTLVSGLAAWPAGASASIHAAAAHGTTGPAGKLPFLDTIQRAFGRHDVSHVQAHVGGVAAEGAAAMGAEAFATGDRVAFASQPSLHTAAHEVAHVVQQRAGVQLLGGVGSAGDAYERHADEVADAVVAGRPAVSLLDAFAPAGAPAAAVQRRLIVGGRAIPAQSVDAELFQAEKNGDITNGELDESDRLNKEARAQQKFAYSDWKSAVMGVVDHDPESLGSTALHAGSIVFTNVSKKYHGRAQQLIDLLAAHPSISHFIHGRPCFLTLMNSDNPATVLDKTTEVHVELASWYFEKYELGYTIGMLCHEFAIHPMADAIPDFAAGEKYYMGIELDTGATKGKTPVTVNTDRADQVDHVLGAMFGLPRNNIYRTAVIEMASLLAAEAAKPKATIQPQEVTYLLDCFLMDCASILATDDHREQGVKVSDVVAALYNDYLGQLATIITDGSVLKLLPQTKSKWGVLKDYAWVGTRLKLGHHGSSQSSAYQPTHDQTTYLSAHGLQLHWIAPDGRCVFGALAHIAGMSTAQAIQSTLTLLQANHAGLATIITNAGETVANVIKCITEGRWAAPGVGDIILEVAATALGTDVTILRPDGTTWDIGAGGRVIVRVTSPLEHYHATT